MIRYFKYEFKSKFKFVTHNLLNITDKNSGFTILEPLVGMVVVSILLIAIAPILIMSTAIRVQAKRVEISSQVARTFIDGVRIGSISKPEIVSQLNYNPNSPRNLAASAGDYLFNSAEMSPPTSANELYCYNQNHIISKTDCTETLFYIQAGRIIQSTQKNENYRLAVRVYRGDIDFGKTIKINTNAPTKQTASIITGGLGDKQAPLIEITTDIANKRTNFFQLCQRLGTPRNAPTSADKTTTVKCQ
jgi:type II secretory pathway pseudopilin PulG